MSDTSKPEILPDGVYVRNPRLADQNLAGKSVLLHYEGRRIVGLNESGTTVWEALDGRRTLREIAADFAAEAAAPEEEILADVLAFVEILAGRELVVLSASDEDDGGR